MEKIKFNFTLVPFALKNKRLLKEYIKKIFVSERKNLTELHVIFCTDRFLYVMNSQFLKHTTYTDILTFRFSKEGEAITAEMYISVERVRDNAISYTTTFTNELHRVIFHGILHLCGYSDKSKADKTLMRMKEDFYMLNYFPPDVPRGTIF